MISNTVLDIERAINTLSPPELQELCAWLDHHKHPLDARIESDLAGGFLDGAIDQALVDEEHHRVQPL